MWEGRGHVAVIETGERDGKIEDRVGAALFVVMCVEIKKLLVRKETRRQ